MLKIFSTQLSSVYNKITAQKEEAIEDSARLISQAILGEGTIYIYASNELNVITQEALFSTEPLKNAVSWNGMVPSDIHPTDCFIIATRSNMDETALQIVKSLQEIHGLVIGISTIVDESKGLHTLVDVHIDLHSKKGLVPNELGERVGIPTSLAALFTFYGIRLTVNEMMSEIED